MVRRQTFPSGDWGTVSEPLTRNSSALFGADGQTGDEVPLQRQVDDQGWQGDVHRSRRDQVVIREELAAEVCQRRGYRPVRTLLLEDHGPEEVVVDPRKLQRGQCR